MARALLICSMPSTLLPPLIGVAPEFAVATPLAAFGPIVWAGSGLIVLLLALHITRTGTPAPLDGDPPRCDAA